MHISFTALIQILRQNFRDAQIEINNQTNKNCVYVEIDNGDERCGHGKCVYNFKTMTVCSASEAWACLFEEVFEQHMTQAERMSEAELVGEELDEEFFRIMKDNAKTADSIDEESTGIVKITDENLDQMIALAEEEEARHPQSARSLA